MADDTFPTAIVPTKSLSTREKFDTLARRLGDPMARLFLLTNATIDTVDPEGRPVTRPDTEMQFRAAAELMPYRYPKLRAAEVTHNGLPPGAGVLNIQINIGSGPQGTTMPGPTTVDVSPGTPSGEKEVSPVTSPVDPLD